VDIPIVIYNVPGRTAVNILPATVAELAAHPRITAIKEASGSLDQVTEILARCEITVLSGDDSLTLPMMAVGAVGVISVASNVAPRPVVEMVRAALAGRADEARKLHDRLYPLFRDLFIDANPIPVKAAMAMQGLIEEVYRLPLCEMDAALKQKLRETLEKTGVL